MSLEIISPSFFTSLQDNGRFGYKHIGVTNSGVMDEFAYNILNLLLNNQKNTNVLEISFSNFKVKFLEETLVALSGADSKVYLNGIEKKVWQSFNVKIGDILEIKKINSGTKLYLGVKDGFGIKKEFGSNSLTIKENLGGINGDFLKKGDILPFKKYNLHYNKRLKQKFIPKYESELTLRVILTYQNEYFSQDEIEKFFSSEFIVTNDFNRMACKLSGKKIISKIKGIVSEGIVFGSIQIPNDGKPIILLKDRQTIGGYPKIGVVLDVDCFKLSQVKPNTKVRFKKISLSEALKKSKKFYNSFNL